MSVLRDYFQPDALDHVFRQVTIFLQYKRTGEAMGRFLLEFDPLRRAAGARGRVPRWFRVEMGSPCCLCAFRVSSLVLCWRNRCDDYFPSWGTERQDVLAAAFAGAKSDGEDSSNEARAAFREAGQKGGIPMGKSGKGPKWPNKVTGDGRTSSGTNRRTGERNRCLARESKYHVGPKCSRRKLSKPNSPVPPPAIHKARRPSNSSMSLGTPVPPRTNGASILNGGGGDCEQSFSTAPGASSQLVCAEEDTVVFLDIGTAVNLV